MSKTLSTKSQSNCFVIVNVRKVQTDGASRTLMGIMAIQALCRDKQHDVILDAEERHRHTLSLLATIGGVASSTGEEVEVYVCGTVCYLFGDSPTPREKGFWTDWMSLRSI